MPTSVSLVPAKIEIEMTTGCCEVRQLEHSMLYKDDSVVVCYSDGSRLLIYPCGASFIHVDHKHRGVATANGLDSEQGSLEHSICC